MWRRSSLEKLQASNVFSQLLQKNETCRSYQPNSQGKREADPGPLQPLRWSLL